MINRAAIILKYKKPAIQWINETDPYKDNPGISEKDANEERTVYLIEDDAAESSAALNQWIRNNYNNLFENELNGWYANPNLWPEHRTLTLFRKWFIVECHTIIIDTVGTAIIEEDI